MQQYPPLQTKLYVPALRPSLVPRSGLCEQMDEKGLPTNYVIKEWIPE